MPRPPGRTGFLPNAGDLHREYTELVDNLRECAEVAVSGVQPNDVALTRNKMPDDHLRITNLEHALENAKAKHRVAGALLRKISDRLERHKVARGAASQ